MILLISALLVSLLPLAGYVLYVSHLNRRAHPTLVAGIADALWLVVALSGFLFYTGPLLIHTWYQRRLRMPLDEEGLQSTDAIAMWAWMLWLGYFLLVLTWIVFSVRRGQKTSAIYNIDRHDFTQVLEDSLRPHGLGFAQSGDSIYIGPIESSTAENPATSSESVQVGLPRPSSFSTLAGKGKDDRFAELEVVFAPGFHHLTVLWKDSSRGMREMLEEEFRRQMGEVVSPANPSGSWFLSISAALFSGILLILFVGTLLMIFPPRRW